MSAVAQPLFGVRYTRPGIIVDAVQHGAARIRGCIGFLSCVVRLKFSKNAQCEIVPA